MPNYDLVCEAGHEQHDVWLRVGERPPCPTCGGATSTLWAASASVAGDDIPGGMWISHGICNEDGTPKKYYTKSDMARAAKAKGLANIVTHVTAPGTDKSRHTVKWV